MDRDRETRGEREKERDTQRKTQRDRQTDTADRDKGFTEGSPAAPFSGRTRASGRLPLYQC